MFMWRNAVLDAVFEVVLDAMFEVVLGAVFDVALDAVADAGDVCACNGDDAMRV